MLVRRVSWGDIDGWFCLLVGKGSVAGYLFLLRICLVAKLHTPLMWSERGAEREK